MRSSLIFKLMGAFLLVIAIGAAVIAVWTSQATQNAFNIYTTRNGQVWAQRLAPQYADFYARTGSWQGVEAFVQTSLGVSGAPGMMMGEGSGPGQGRGPGAGRQPGGSGMMGGMGQRLILTNEKGVVIADTQNELKGKLLSPSELKAGEAVMVKDVLVGTLVVTPLDLVSSVNPASEFLATVNQAILSSALIASVIALILGSALFFQIISPLRQLKKAASAIAGGELNQRVAIRSRDELGELGAAFNHMAKSLEEAETQRSHLVADVAHELRTPLTAIQGTLEGMQDGVLPLDEEQVSALLAETMLLNRLVNDLRLLSLAEAGQLKLEKQEVNPAEWLNQLIERLRPQAELKKIHLDSQIASNLPEIWMDSDRLTQVVNNLVSNALRYTPEGGILQIAAHLSAGKALPGSQAAAPAAAPSLEVSVTDSGPGIAAQDLPFIFDRFYRADKSRARASGGSGLGLAIVRQLVEAHGGRVWAESPVFSDSAPGTRIIFTIPTRPAEKQ